MKAIRILAIIGMVFVVGMAEAVSKMGMGAQLCLVMAGAIACFLIIIIPAIKVVRVKR